MVYITSFIVGGQQVFPLDMLRYDACYPGSSESVDAMHCSLDRYQPKQLVTLVHVNSHAGWQPTKGRWESFGWHIITTKTSRV